MPYTDDPQVQTMIANMPTKTDKNLEEWLGILGASGLEKHGELMRLLKDNYGVSHGYANTIVLIFRQQAEGGAKDDEELIASQYAGPKEVLKPIYEAIVRAATDFGPDVQVAPKKTYVSLRRGKQFAIVKAATKTRVDLGLNLKEVERDDRLEGGDIFGGMCTHVVRLSSEDEVDDQIIDWLRQAYETA